MNNKFQGIKKFQMKRKTAEIPEKLKKFVRSSIRRKIV